MTTEQSALQWLERLAWRDDSDSTHARTVLALLYQRKHKLDSIMALLIDDTPAPRKTAHRTRRVDPPDMSG